MTPTRVAVSAVGVVVVLFFGLLILSSGEPESEPPLPSPSSKPTRPPGASLAFEITPQAFRDRSTEIHTRRESLTPEESTTIQAKCDQFTQHEQLLDIDCTALWLNRLKSEKITGVERLWGFKNTHYGAITINLENGMRAMFKPCTSKSEDTSKELIASYLDQLLGYGQTAPVATRIIPVSVIEKYCTSYEMRATLKETADKCALTGGFFLGPMIGWWDSLIPVRTTRKYKEDVETLLEVRRPFLGDNLYPAQAMSKFHSFYLLVHILRHGKDEFITKDGNLVSLDLDRSRFRSTAPLMSPSMNYTWCYTCYMDQWVYDTFRAVGPAQSADFRLGALMKEMLSHEELFTDLFDSRLGAALDTRVDMLLDCVDGCIAKYGRENVLLNEEQTMSAKEVVEWFVLNSEYKKQNGKEGPSDLEFLDRL